MTFFQILYLPLRSLAGLTHLHAGLESFVGIKTLQVINGKLVLALAPSLFKDPFPLFKDPFVVTSTMFICLAKGQVRKIPELFRTLFVYERSTYRFVNLRV